MAAPPLNLKIQLTALPLPVIENIFSYLNCEDVSRIGHMCLELSEIAVSFIKRQTEFVGGEVKHLLTKSKDYIKEATHPKGKVEALQFFKKLTCIHTEIDYMLALIKYAVENKEISLEIGRLADCFRSCIREVPVINLDNRKVHLQFLKFLKSIEDNYRQSRLKFGIQIMDILQVLRHTHLELIAIYRLKENTCEINGICSLKRAKFLRYISELPSTCVDYRITQKEQGAFVKYLTLIVAVQNILKTKEEHYRQDIMKNNLQVCNEQNNESRREVIDAENCIIKETYTKRHSVKWDDEDNDLTYSIHLECNIEDAPLQIKSYHSNLLTDIETQKEDLKCLNTEIIHKSKNLNHIHVFKLEMSFRRSLGSQKSINALKLTLTEHDE